MRERLLYGVIVRRSTETAVPPTVITVMRPVCPPAAAISATGTTMVDPLLGVIVTDLSRQNFTVNEDVPNPEPEIVRDPPALSEIVVAESDVIVGAPTASTVTVLIPPMPIPAPPPVGADAVGIKRKKVICAVTVSTLKFRVAAFVTKMLQ